MSTNTSKSNNSQPHHNDSGSPLRRTNYLIVSVACAIIVAGLALMAGDGSTESTFNPEIFSCRRIVIAPLTCLVGYLLVIVGIMWPCMPRRPDARR